MKVARQTTSVLTLFTGPLLLAAAVSADGDDGAWWSSPFKTDAETDPAPSPVAYSYDFPTSSPTEIYAVYPDTVETSSPTEIYAEPTDGGEMYDTPIGEDGDGEEEEEPMPMDEKPEGASCSTYDEDVSCTTNLFTTRRCFSNPCVPVRRLLP